MIMAGERDRTKDIRTLEERGVEDSAAGQSVPMLSSSQMRPGQMVSNLRGVAPVGPPRQAMADEDAMIRSGLQAIEKSQAPLGTYGGGVMNAPSKPGTPRTNESGFLSKGDKLLEGAPQGSPVGGMKESGFLSKGDSLNQAPAGGPPASPGGPPTARFSDAQPLSRDDPYSRGTMPGVQQPALPPARAMSEQPMGPPGVEARRKPTLAELQATQEASAMTSAQAMPGYFSDSEKAALTGGTADPSGGGGGFARGLAAAQGNEDEIRRIRAGYDYTPPRY